MVNTKKIVSYAFLAIGCVFFLIAFYIRLFGSGKHEWESEKSNSMSRWLIILSGISILISVGNIASSKSKLHSKDVLQILVISFCVLSSIVAVFTGCNAFVFGLTILSAILACVMLDMS